MYEDSFNNIVDECAFYRYKLNDRYKDKKSYVDDYVISQRSWLDFYLGGHNYKKHSLISNGLGLYYKTELRNGIKIKEKNKGVKIAIKSPYKDLESNVIVGQKCQLEIGGKDRKSTVSLNLINIDMQYWNTEDVPKLSAELEKLNLGKNPTLLVGTLPLNRKVGITGSSSGQNQQQGGAQESVIMLSLIHI